MKSSNNILVVLVMVKWIFPFHYSVQRWYVTEGAQAFWFWWALGKSINAINDKSIISASYNSYTNISADIYLFPNSTWLPGTIILKSQWFFGTPSSIWLQMLADIPLEGLSHFPFLLHFHIHNPRSDPQNYIPTCLQEFQSCVLLQTIHLHLIVLYVYNSQV